MRDAASRRTLLATAALVAPASLLPAIATAAEDHRSSAVTGDQAPDPHPAWLAEWRGLVAWAGTADTDGRALHEFPQHHRLLELEELIHGTPARTLAGVLAQLRVLHHWHGDSATLNDTDSAGLANAIATLERPAGEAGDA